ncbi:uncharacterized protein A4U43_C07F35680 [Asparagus officinalis]|uniref:Uncharacterized protein n=1 Tax=Asparagus officinalis TaxID=4686 RepID=A0A5P1EJC7_ASPOF|nr:uncharacterized protein A4U43_C07F35680 [Asparagus officinalis]
METLGAPSDPISISLHAVSLSIELDSISNLINTPRFAQTRQYLESSIHDGTNPDGDPNFFVAVSALSIEIGNEIYQLFESAREIYQLKFLELGWVVSSEEDFFSAVKQIETETDPTRVDLNSISPPVWMPRVVEGSIEEQERPA